MTMRCLGLLVPLLLLVSQVSSFDHRFRQTVTIEGVSVDLSFFPLLGYKSECAKACQAVREIQPQLSTNCESQLYVFLKPQVDAFLEVSVPQLTFGHTPPRPPIADGVVNIPFYNESFIEYTNSMVKGLIRIDVFRAETRALLAQPDTERMVQLATQAKVQTVGSSTRIEGATLRDVEVAALLNATDPVLETRSQQEVMGCADLITHLTDNYHTVQITEETLLNMHDMLLKHSQVDQSHKGRYKEHEVNVNAYDQNGNYLYTMMRSTIPAETPQQMRQLMEWYNTEQQIHNLHPIVRTGIFIVTFLKIHPFEDGNGRISRALTDLLLQQSGYTHIKYSSSTRWVEWTKDAYYDALQATQATLDGSAPNWTPFLEYFVRMLVNQLEPLRREWKTVD